MLGVKRSEINASTCRKSKMLLWFVDAITIPGGVDEEAIRKILIQLLLI